MAEQAVWQPSKSKLDGYKVHQFGLHALRERVVWQEFSLHVCQVSQKRPPQWVHTSQANDGEWCLGELWSKALVRRSLWTSRWSLSAREHPTQRSLPLHSHFLPPFLLTNSLLERDGCTKQTFCHSLEWHPEAVSWCWVLLWMAAAATLQFSRGFCFLLSCWGTVHNLHFSLPSWTSLGLTRGRLPGDGGKGKKQQQNTKLGQSTHKPDEGTVSSCVWFCSTSKSTILMEEEKQCHL